MSLSPADRFQAFVLTANRSRAIPFYRDVIGLPLLAEDPFAATFDIGGEATMRLTDHQGWEPMAHTVVGWVVQDIEAAVRALADQGVACAIYDGFGQDDLGIWSGPGAKVAWFKDPDGNVLSYTQMTG